MQTTFERIQDILVNQLNVRAAGVTPSTRIVDDLGADSLDQIELIIALEEDFALRDEVPALAFVNLVTVQAVVDYVDKAAKHPPADNATGVTERPPSLTPSIDQST